MNIASGISPTDTGTPLPPPNEYVLEREEALARRYSRKPLPPLAFEFTRDPALLHQYYKLRENEYNSFYGINPMSGAEGEHDHTGHIMVVRMGNQVVGGARINTRTPRKPTLLPLEIDDFRLEHHFPQLRRKQLSYGQACSMVLLPEFRGGDIVREMVKRVCTKGVALNLAVLFATCPLSNARLYKKACVSVGLVDTQVHMDIELPLYKYLESIPLYLLSIPLDRAFTKPSIAFAPGIKTYHLADA
jgi:hypothetical protein